MISSPYVDIMKVDKDGKASWCELGPTSNKDLMRVYDEMVADQNKLKELFHAPDSFSASLPVYTYGPDGTIVEKLCETPGWPNVTHDGCLQYANTFSTDRSKLLQTAIRHAKAALDATTSQIKDMQKDLMFLEETKIRQEKALHRLLQEETTNT